ncbi:MAG TPA: hypothetical protein VIL86_17150 [Tepidisphaeraceae bacterium]
MIAVFIGKYVTKLADNLPPLRYFHLLAGEFQSDRLLAYVWSLGVGFDRDSVVAHRPWKYLQETGQVGSEEFGGLIDRNLDARATINFRDQ